MLFESRRRAWQCNVEGDYGVVKTSVFSLLGKRMTMFVLLVLAT